MITVEKMTLDDVNYVLQLAADEGWNPGLDDASAFFQADPMGFLMVKNEGKTVACISVIRQGDHHGFLGLYICHPDYRGKGFGWAVWQAGMKYLHGRTIGLDGVPEQQDNYRKSGFEYHYRNIRFAGQANALHSDSELTELLNNSDLTIRKPKKQDMESLQNLDSIVHGLQRHAYLQSWLKDAPSRTTLLCTDKKQLIGYGTIRQCLHGYKVGPLVAQQADIAALLVSGLANCANTNELIVDVPEPNDAAVKLAESLGLSPAFETARMYRGEAPNYQLQQLFGVTSFELG